jgi:hypothetical protein
MSQQQITAAQTLCLAHLTGTWSVFVVNACSGVDGKEVRGKWMMSLMEGWMDG